MKKFLKKYWWVVLIALLLIGGGLFLALNGLLKGDKEVQDVVDTIPATIDPFDLDLTKDLAFNLDIIKRYLAEDEWALQRFTVYKDYLDQHAGELSEGQMPVYYQLLANYNFRYRLNNGHWNEPLGESLIDLQYDSNLYERGALLVEMSNYNAEKRFNDFYSLYKDDLPDMYFSTIGSAWDSILVEEPEPEYREPREPREPKEKEIIETPSQKLLKALRNYSPQTPEATIREQVYLNRYPEYKTSLQALSKAVQNERNSSANHRATHYEECLKGAEDFEELLVRYGI